MRIDEGDVNEIASRGEQWFEFWLSDAVIVDHDNPTVLGFGLALQAAAAG